MTEKRFNCHVKFSAMPNGIMVLDYERHGDEQTVIEDISREKAHRVMDRLNELKDENEQLKSDNNRLVKETAEKVAEHQQRVLDLIDEQIIRLKKYDEIRDDDWYIGQIDVLKNLKKELSE